MAFTDTLATQIKLAPPRDREFKGLVIGANGYLESSFLPGGCSCQRMISMPGSTSGGADDLMPFALAAPLGQRLGVRR